MTKKILDILIVEDEFFVAMDFEDFLTNHGKYTVTVAQSVEDAKAQLLSKKISLAIFDINLGGRSSLPLIEKAFSLGIKTIIVSGSRVADDIIEATNSIYFTKPCDIDELLDSVNLLMSQAQVSDHNSNLPKPPVWLDYL